MGVGGERARDRLGAGQGSRKPIAQSRFHGLQLVGSHSFPPRLSQGREYGIAHVGRMGFIREPRGNQK